MPIYLVAAIAAILLNRAKPFVQLLAGCFALFVSLDPELQCLLRRLKLSIDFSGCEKYRLKLIKIKIVLIFLKITMISLTTNAISFSI